jgi:hypothetical protein
VRLKWRKVKAGVYNAASPWGLYTIDGTGYGRNRWTVTYPGGDYGMVDALAEAKAWAEQDAEQRRAKPQPAHAKKRAGGADKLGAVREVFDGATATLLDRFAVDGVEIPRVRYDDATSLVGAIVFVADVVDPRDRDPVVQKFVADYEALAGRGVVPPRRSFSRR